MKSKDFFLGLFLVTMAIIAFALVMTLIYAAVSYAELRGVIKDCNEKFGAGNWTFKEDSESYRCGAFNRSSYTTCYVNGVQVPC